MLTEQSVMPLEDVLRRAYYYTESGEWRGPEVDEWSRWHAVAKVVAEKLREVEEERDHYRAEFLASY